MKSRTLRAEDLPYRPCVGIMLINHDGLVWMGRRIPKWESTAIVNPWQMPQGGIDKDENPRDAAMRELEEETGVRNVEIVGETPDWLTYDLPAEAIGVALKGKYRGQKQMWYAMKFLGHDNEINISPDQGEKPEFDAWKWTAVDDITDMVVPFKRDVYTQVVSAFRQHTG